MSMRKTLCRLALLWAVAAGGVARAETATNIINGVTTNFPDTYYYVGNTGPNNVLIITNAGRLNVMAGADSVIGNLEGASNNFATVTGAGSLWQTGYLTLGLNGGGNKLTIANGGVVNATGAYAGYESNSANNMLIVTGMGSTLNAGSEFMFGENGLDNQLIITNGGLITVAGLFAVGKYLRVNTNNNPVANNDTVLVTGAGSLLSISNTLYVGYSGVGNQLTIAAGGEVKDIKGVLGQANDSGNQNNRVIVTGANSKWINSDVLLVGDTTSGNHLTITNGGLVVNTDGQLGYAASITVNSTNTVDNNTVLVTGSGSVWSNTGALYVGRQGVGNSLTITNSGAVTVAGNAYISYDTFAANNAIAIAGGSLAVGGTLDVRNGTLGFNGGTLTAYQLVVTNNTSSATNSLFTFNYGTLTTLGGAQLVAPAGSNFFIGNTAGQIATWNILGGTNSILPVTGSAADTLLGGVAGAAAKVLVAGGGTVWTNGGDLHVGYNAAGSQLAITNGATVYNGTGYVGYNAGASNNTALVTDPNSVWNNGGELSVGYGSGGNQLTIANGGAVSSASGFIGRNDSAGSNTVFITGASSVWNAGVTFVVGGTSAGNQLTIANGGLLNNQRSVIGSSASASNNTVLVTGTNSVWNNSNYLSVGNQGSGNSLTISNGGTVCAVSVTLGAAAGSSNNTLAIDGGSLIATNPINGLVWVQGGTLAFNGGTVAALGLRATNNTSSATNSVFAFNAGTLTTLSGAQLVVPAGGNFIIGNTAGQAAAWNILGGTNSILPVPGKSTSIYLGGAAGATANVLVTGGGTVWTNGGLLYVGYNGAGSQLTLTNGGTVYSAGGYFGGNASASNNTALVTGGGSTWNAGSALVVGNAGAGNTLTIANSGQVVNATGYIGGGSSNNTVLVTDGGSVWNNASNLIVGNNGAGNRLTVTNGGGVSVAGTSFVGFSPGAGNNAVLVTGSGSVWSSGGALLVGYSSGGNRLTVANSGTVLATNIVLGYGSATGNGIDLTGGQLYATNAGGTGTLDVRRGTVALNSGSILADTVLLTNGLNGTLAMSGGTLAVNTLTNDGSANILLAGGTLQPLNANGNWSAALVVSNLLTLNTADAGGLARSNVLSGALSGGGTLNITGTGKLSVNGSAMGCGWINVQSGATLGGTSSMASVQILSNATLAAGNSIGTFTATNLTLAAGAHVQEQLDATHGVAGMNWDLITVNGPAALSGISSSSPLTVDVYNYGGLDGAVGPTNTLVWNFLDASGGITGYDPQAFVVTTTGLEGWTNGAWSVSQTGNSLQLTFLAIPEPVSATLVFLLGGALVGWRRLRRWS